MTLQHAFLLQESIVVLVFWGILFPYLGLNGGGKHNTANFKYMMVYKHTVPFLIMLHDFMHTHGHYTNSGTVVCLSIYVIYYIYN